ncbi:MAG: DUF692 domain-containing protein [Rhodobacterales bacterium]|nr:DUF692 domain-containing protein [Rhodobacterales bacterium]
MSPFSSASIPPREGVGLKPRHYDRVLADGPDLGWFEVHTENYMGDGGPPHRYLTAIRERYPLSLHGVGLSLGSAEAPDARHLARIRALVDRYEPGLVSEHLSWSIAGGTFSNDLLPLPYTEETLAVVARNIDIAQDALGRTLLVENPSTYLQFADSTIPEPDYLAELARRTGCGILLDVNNLYVCAMNHGFDPIPPLDALAAGPVGEIHLAGHALRRHRGQEIRIDDHGSPVIDPVWALYERVLARTGPVPTLIEWDTDVPEFHVLLDQAEQARRRLANAKGRGHASAA